MTVRFDDIDSIFDLYPPNLGPLKALCAIQKSCIALLENKVKALESRILERDCQELARIGELENEIDDLADALSDKAKRIEILEHIEADQNSLIDDLSEQLRRSQDRADNAYKVGLSLAMEIQGLKENNQRLKDLVNISYGKISFQ